MPPKDPEANTVPVSPVSPVVTATPPELTEEQKNQVIATDKKDRAEKATIALQEILKQYNCYTDIALLISTNGTLKGSITIIAR